MMVIIDFDGTIVDVWKRYYRVFCAAMGFPAVSIEEYKTAKLLYNSDEVMMVELGLEVPHDYYFKKRQLLEEKHFLKEDSLIIERQTLLDWFQKTDSIILTKRRSRDNLFFELDSLGLGDLKRSAIVLNPDSGVSKRKWVEDNLSILGDFRGYMIGDSEEDMLVGWDSPFRSLFVKSGLRAYNDEYEADDVFEHIGEAMEYIELIEHHAI